MKKLFLFSCLFVSLMAQAQKEKGEAYISMYKEIAISEMMRTGVPAAITLAQGILESQFGESDLVKGSNNHFGIKCKTEWTGPKIYHDDDEKGECFRVYPTAEDSYRDHSDFLKTRPNYAFLFKLDPTDFDGWAKGLKKAGYATSPTYPQKLLKVIGDYNLQQYSLEALARLKNPPAPIETHTAAEIKPLVATNGTETKTISDNATTAIATSDKSTPEQTFAKEETAAVQQAETPTPAPLAKVKRQVNYPSGIFTINHTRVIYATEGTSLLSLANQYDIPLAKLIDFNELEPMDVLDTDRLMFIERKAKKGAGDFHTVADGETLHDIAQLEGVRLESLMEYNHLAKNASLGIGNKVLLHAPVTATSTARSPK